MTPAFNVQRWWPAQLLPREDGRQVALLFVIATLCFLASLAAIGGLAADRAAAGWRDQLTGSATVIVRSTGLETADAAAARAAEALAEVKGVTEARAIEKAKAEALLAPWIGPDALPADLPVPRLVAVELDRKRPATTADLARALKAAGLEAIVDDHTMWTKEIMHAGDLARWVAIGLFVLITAAAGAVIAFATRQGLAARRDVVEVLHLAGANDGFIARLFQYRFARTSALAEIAGGAAATLCAAALQRFGHGQTLAAIMPVRWTDLLAPLPAPFLAALIAAVTARLTAEAVLEAFAVKGLAAVLVALLIWTAGLVAFAARVERLTPAPEPPVADGIVALTGASDLRLEAAMRLLENGKGRRLLVSGVNRKTTRADVRSVTGAAKPVFDCCVDLGFTAADTVGNARETAEWARSMHYRTLILVTADFHMPRATLELRSALPEARIIPYPVATPTLDARHWQKTGRGAERMVLEYSKYLAILGRETVIGLGPKEPPKPAAAAAL